MGFIETSYGSNPNLSQVNIDSNLNMDTFGISAGGAVSFSGGLDLNNTDLTGVKRFMCADYLGAVKATASSTTQTTLNLNDLTSQGHTKLFRIPSNFVTSTIKVSYKAAGTSSQGCSSQVDIYDPSTETYTHIYLHSTPMNTTETVVSDPITVNAGELFCISKGGSGTVYGSATSILYDLEPATGAVWEVITP